MRKQYESLMVIYSNVLRELKTRNYEKLNYDVLVGMLTSLVQIHNENTYLIQELKGKKFLYLFKTYKERLLLKVNKKILVLMKEILFILNKREYV